MPGKNNAFDPSKVDWLTLMWTSNVWRGVIGCMLLMIVWGMVRVYGVTLEVCEEEPSRCESYTNYCFTVVIFVLMQASMIVISLYKAKDADPGYLIPGQETQGEEENDFNESIPLCIVPTGMQTVPDKEDDKEEIKDDTTCKKCGLVKSHDRISHCSRCNRCVNYMDHHCLFTDNCIGKKNAKYFFAFVSWTVFTLMTAGIFFLKHCVWRTLSLRY